MIPLAYRYGKLGCDAPTALLEYMVDQAAQLITSQGSPDFVLLTGDLVRHGNDRLSSTPLVDTQTILANVTQVLLRASLGDNLSIIPALGNNDLTPDYYLDLANPQASLAMVTKL